MKRTIQTLVIYIAFSIVLTLCRANETAEGGTNIESGEELDNTPVAPRIIDRTCIDKSFQTAGQWTGGQNVTNEGQLIGEEFND